MTDRWKTESHLEPDEFVVARGEAHWILSPGSLGLDRERDATDVALEEFVSQANAAVAVLVVVTDRRFVLIMRDVPKASDFDLNRVGRLWVEELPPSFDPDHLVVATSGRAGHGLLQVREIEDGEEWDLVADRAFLRSVVEHIETWTAADRT